MKVAYYYCKFKKKKKKKKKKIIIIKEGNLGKNTLNNFKNTLSNFNKFTRIVLLRQPSVHISSYVSCVKEEENRGRWIDSVISVIRMCR